MSPVPHLASDGPTITWVPCGTICIGAQPTATLNEQAQHQDRQTCGEESPKADRQAAKDETQDRHRERGNHEIDAGVARCQPSNERVKQRPERQGESSTAERGAHGGSPPPSERLGSKSEPEERPEHEYQPPEAAREVRACPKGKTGRDGRDPDRRPCGAPCQSRT
jgi:hypothetical protein